MESNSKKFSPKSAAVMSLLAAMFVGAIAGLAGCNTTQGVGEDIEAAGDAIADTARDAKD